jgi:hypothetical protein
MGTTMKQMKMELEREECAFSYMKNGIISSKTHVVSWKNNFVVLVYQHS